MLLSPTGGTPGAVRKLRSGDRARPSSAALAPINRGLTPPGREPRRKPKLINGRPACQHCGQRKATRPRTLCWPCYYDRTIREQYPTKTNTGRRGIGFGDARAMPERTDALPGTPEKMRVLMERAARGQHLFRDDEPRCDTASGLLALLSN
jgi:hypothetical protein